MKLSKARERGGHDRGTVIELSRKGELSCEGGCYREAGW